MKIVHPDKWLPCDGISLEEAADTAVRCSDRHVLVVAGPGAGKTELLAQKATEVCASGNWAEDDGNIALFIADNEQLEAAAVSKDILLKVSFLRNM